MKNPLFYLFFLLLLACEKPTKNQLSSNETISAEQANLITDKTKNFPNGTQLSCALIENGEVKFAGIERRNDSIQLVNNLQRAFEIGSITKVFTGILLANFILEERLKLDDPINDYLDVKFNVDSLILFRDLANHTAGLPRLPDNLDLGEVDESNPYKDYDEEMLISYLKNELRISKRKKGKSRYSNLGVGLLGYTLWQIDGTDYETLIKRYIIDSLAMNNTTSLRKNVESIVVKGRDANGDETSNWDLASLVAAGGVLSTADDMAKFAMAQFDSTNQAFSLARQQTFQKDSTFALGLCWAINLKNGTPSKYWHNGGTGGYTSYMVVDVQQNSGVVILSNLSAFHDESAKIDQLGYGLLETLK